MKNAWPVQETAGDCATATAIWGRAAGEGAKDAMGALEPLWLLLREMRTFGDFGQRNNMIPFNF